MIDKIMDQLKINVAQYICKKYGWKFEYPQSKLLKEK